MNESELLGRPWTFDWRNVDLSKPEVMSVDCLRSILGDVSTFKNIVDAKWQDGRSWMFLVTDYTTADMNLKLTHCLSLHQLSTS